MDRRSSRTGRTGAPGGCRLRPAVREECGPGWQLPSDSSDPAAEGASDLDARHDQGQGWAGRRPGGPAEVARMEGVHGEGRRTTGL
jgi:hypothetical protein